jgi:hypothetical protein
MRHTGELWSQRRNEIWCRRMHDRNGIECELASLSSFQAAYWSVYVSISCLCMVDTPFTTEVEPTANAQPTLPPFLKGVDRQCELYRRCSFIRIHSMISSLHAFLANMLVLLAMQNVSLINEANDGVVHCVQVSVPRANECPTICIPFFWHAHLRRQEESVLAREKTLAVGCWWIQLFSPRWSHRQIIWKVQWHGIFSASLSTDDSSKLLRLAARVLFWNGRCSSYSGLRRNGTAASSAKENEAPVHFLTRFCSASSSHNFSFSARQTAKRRCYSSSAFLLSSRRSFSDKFYFSLRVSFGPKWLAHCSSFVTRRSSFVAASSRPSPPWLDRSLHFSAVHVVWNNPFGFHLVFVNLITHHGYGEIVSDQQCHTVMNYRDRRPPLELMAESIRRNKETPLQ